MTAADNVLEQKRGPDSSQAIESRVRRRMWPIVVSVVLVATGLAYTFFWSPVVRHTTGWIQPGDIWGTYRASQFISWGDIGDLYQDNTGFISFPGIALLLAPVALLTDHFNLIGSFPYALPHPSAWPILAPITLLSGLVPLFAFDAIAEHLSVTRALRMLMCWVQGVILWPMLVLWGHPEDAIALGLAAYALLAAWKRKWRAAGWLLGAAFLFQPLVVLLAPLLLAQLPNLRERLLCVVRTVLPAAVFLVLPLIESWTATTTALVKQPTFPSIDHPTPFLFMAPVIGHLKSAVGFSFLRHGSGGRFITSIAHGQGVIVAPGPARILALAFAAGIGIYAWRRQPSPAVVVWLCALAFSVWCFVEPVMTPYYVWPALGFVVLAGSTRSVPRFALIATGAIFVTVWVEQLYSKWNWWAPAIGVLGVCLFFAHPNRARSGEPAVREDTASPPVADTLEGAAPALTTR